MSGTRQIFHHWKPILLIFIGLYIAAQIIMPRIGLSLILNFDTSCYSGSFSYIEKISADASCGTHPDPGFVGFPFVINFHYNSHPQQLATLLLDSLPIIVAVALLLISAHLGRSAKALAKE